MWFIIGIILGAAILGLAIWMRSNHITFKWYEWLLGVIGLFLLLFSLQNFFTAFDEAEPQAAWMSLLVFGLPAIILLVVGWQLAAQRRREESRT